MYISPVLRIIHNAHKFTLRAATVANKCDENFDDFFWMFKIRKKKARFFFERFFPDFQVL